MRIWAIRASGSSDDTAIVARPWRWWSRAGALLTRRVINDEESDGDTGRTAALGMPGRRPISTEAPGRPLAWRSCCGRVGGRSPARMSPSSCRALGSRACRSCQGEQHGGRDLGDQSVAHGVRSEYVSRRRRATSCAPRHRGRIQAEKAVDRRDDEAGDGVALHELQRAVHGAVEGSLSAMRRRRWRLELSSMQPGGQVGVDRPSACRAWHRD